MAGNFCTQCGAPLEEEGLRFCTQCGASLADADDMGAAAGFGATPISMAAGYTVPAEVYQPRAGAAAGVPGQVPAGGMMAGQGVHRPAGGASAAEDDKSVMRKGAIIGVIAGLVIAAIIVFVVYRPLPGPSGGSDSGAELVTTAVEDGQSGESEESDSQGSEDAGSSDAESEQSSADDGTQAAAEAVDYYDDLVGYYDAMPGYDSQIADCATTFNYDYTKSDYTTRQAGADEATRVHDNVNADLAALQALDVPSDNPYYGDWQHMVELMTDLQHRIDVIDQAWQNSLSYSDPANHVDAIIAPLSADNVDGVNKYKTHYDDNYAAWAPTKR